MSGDQLGSGLVAGLLSSPARRIAFQGRQKSKWYLSFQALIAASAPLRFCMAKRRAAARASKPSRLASCVPTSFQLIIGLLCHQRAKYVWSGVRSSGAAVAEPFAFTSLKSTAYAAPPIGSGSTLRNCEPLSIRNGLTPPTHGLGSRMG